MMLERSGISAACLRHTAPVGLFDRIRRRNDGPRPEPEVTEGALRLAELVPQGGGWSGLLFDNPSIGLSPALTWAFDFQFGEVSRDYGDSPVSLRVDGVPLPGANWSAMAGHAGSWDAFAAPVECSVYFFEHYRYDAVQVSVLEQRASRLRVAVEAHGDVDGLGIPVWSVEQWLDFEGISVQLSDTDTLEDASARLAEHTDVSALVGAASARNFKFVEPRG